MAINGKERVKSLTALNLWANEFNVIKVETKCLLLNGIDYKNKKILHDVLENPMWNKTRRIMFRSILTDVFTHDTTFFFFYNNKS